MIPGKHVVPANLTAENRKRELITVSGVAEEEQTVEGHVELFEFCIAAKLFVVIDDAREWPDKPQAVLALDAIGFAEATAKILRKANTQFGLSQLQLRFAHRSVPGSRRTVLPNQLLPHHDLRCMALALS